MEVQINGICNIEVFKQKMPTTKRLVIYVEMYCLLGQRPLKYSVQRSMVRQFLIVELRVASILIAEVFKTVICRGKMLAFKILN